MKKFEVKTLILYILISIYIIFSTFIGYKYLPNLTDLVITPIFWIIIFFISVWINFEYKERIKFQKVKIENIFIIVTGYLIIYFLFGLLIGYSKSAYNHTLIGYIKNIWQYLIPIIFIEYTRKTILSCNNSKLNDILSIILFTLISINLYSLFINEIEYVELFKNFSSIFIPTLTSNMLLMYTSKTCGFYGNLFYRIPQELVFITLPIIPNFDWYYTAIFGILLPLFVYIFIKNFNIKFETNESKRNIRKKSTLRLVPILIPLIIFICFVAGLFKYVPTAILSNSMHPIFDRGDAVVIEKISKNNYNKLKKYDIIEYRINGTTVAHRIINIEKHNDGTLLFTTKGDNNNAPDIKKVETIQIIGKVKTKIPKIGYPSVWLNDFFNKNKKINIETGKQ